MPLWLVGTGISGIKSIPSEGEDAICKADVIYYEQFTSPSPMQNMKEHITNISPDTCAIKDAKRWMVEDGSQILEDAKKKDVILLSYGDPLVATTHTELLYRAAKSHIQTNVIHASSGPTSIIGECGLHHYKMGKMATVMRDPKSMTTPYYTIYKNAIERCHTLLLLEYDYEGTENNNSNKDSFFLEPADALDGLLTTEDGQRRGVIHANTYAIIASRVGMQGVQSITAGKISSLIAVKDFGSPPHSIIIPSTLHFTESDALGTLARCIDPPPRTDTPHTHTHTDTQMTSDTTDSKNSNMSDASKKSNPNVPERISEQMIVKYAPMIRRSINEVKQRCTEDKAMLDILENAGLYVNDAEDFIKRDGHEEVAVLSIGYADGLADAIRLLMGLDTGDKSKEL